MWRCYYTHRQRLKPPDTGVTAEARRRQRSTPGALRQQQVNNIQAAAQASPPHRFARLFGTRRQPLTLTTRSQAQHRCDHWATRSRIAALHQHMDWRRTARLSRARYKNTPPCSNSRYRVTHSPAQ
ncbi:hypothetical protein MRX96_028748 [Rhipicephalus microplus]